MNRKKNSWKNQSIYMDFCMLSVHQDLQQIQNQFGQRTTKTNKINKAHKQSNNIIYKIVYQTQSSKAYSFLQIAQKLRYQLQLLFNEYKITFISIIVHTICQQPPTNLSNNQSYSHSSYIKTIYQKIYLQKPQLTNQLTTQLILYQLINYLFVNTFIYFMYIFQLNKFLKQSSTIFHIHLNTFIHLFFLSFKFLLLFVYVFF
ncbi:transmembrane protein, putative (macronuclear) [Tetrahymena thermophila SB210]|uniref:Transmembrane protein, putative n=1 Tax=Tetrahymena thermophila (strain SB210) TaxID=312017 RepID=W7XAH9_TETTS|nr:transmembrane protein, putative [Tetrahymena thermophila SB210]EWS73408.1 transmembrane protein, putative [Tetrahymena thermophila SB210]|eukprot:XP_012654060.1 transmembrane protein, putative [Tetrahymena thermophila SB210]